MPPKIKVTREDIIRASMEIVRENGTQLLNARNIAAALNCSTQPIFSNFTSMEELQMETVAAAYRIYLGFLEREAASGKYPQYKAFGMAYIQFAKEEKELFKFLFMRDRTGEELSPTPDFEKSLDMVVDAIGLEREEAMLFHLEMWSCVHGIGTMLATSYLNLEMDLVSDMLTDIYQGIRTRYREKKNDCN